MSPRKRFLIVSSAILSCDAEMRRSVSFRRMPYEPQTSVVPFVLPPVGHFGRPLRDLDDSPALGMSQLNVDGVDENVRRCVVAWAQRLCKAECMQHARVVKEERRDEGALLPPTRIVVAITAVCVAGLYCVQSSIKHRSKSEVQAVRQQYTVRHQCHETSKRVTISNASKPSHRKEL